MAKEQKRTTKRRGPLSKLVSAFDPNIGKKSKNRAL